MNAFFYRLGEVVAYVIAVVAVALVGVAVGLVLAAAGLAGWPLYVVTLLLELVLGALLVRFIRGRP